MTRHTLLRRPLLRAALVLAAAACLGGAQAADLPYDETADAPAALAAAKADAAQAGVPVLVIFGANWCKDCRALDTALKAGPNAALMAREFRVVKVDVGNFDRNLALNEAFGKPIAKGIPAAVLLSAQGQVLYATRAGELADARSMSDTGVHDFFVQALANTKAAAR